MSCALPAAAMRRITLQELAHLGVLYTPSLTRAAAHYGRSVKLYLHWSAGHYGQFFEDYHVQIDADGAVYVIRDGALDDVLAATYLRNSGSVSLCLLGCAQAGTEGLGQEPPTALQIEAMAQASAALAAGLQLPIDPVHVMTHGEAADNEDGLTPHAPYGPKHGCERWDLEYLGTAESPCFNPWASGGTRGGDVLRGKALWYQEALWG